MGCRKAGVKHMQFIGNLNGFMLFPHDLIFFKKTGSFKVTHQLSKRLQKREVIIKFFSQGLDIANTSAPLINTLR